MGVNNLDSNKTKLLVSLLSRDIKEIPSRLEIMGTCKLLLLRMWKQSALCNLEDGKTTNYYWNCKMEADVEAEAVEVVREWTTSTSHELYAFKAGMPY